MDMLSKNNNMDEKDILNLSENVDDYL